MTTNQAIGTGVLVGHHTGRSWAVPPQWIIASSPEHVWDRTLGQFLAEQSARIGFGAK